jgi:hypothetical protein
MWIGVAKAKLTLQRFPRKGKWSSELDSLQPSFLSKKRSGAVGVLVFSRRLGRLLADSRLIFGTNTW